MLVAEVPEVLAASDTSIVCVVNGTRYKLMAVAFP